MKLTKEQYLQFIDKEEIPPCSPGNLHTECLFYPFRDYLTNRGMWAIIDQVWTKQLADWIGTRQCLEVMAGAGWLAKALRNAGTKIIATDDYSWDKTIHRKIKRVFPVECMDALAAVKFYQNAEVLLISWPPYNEEEIHRVCQEWGTDRPIIYIGEPDGGCNAPPIFFKHFIEIANFPLFHFPRHAGLHDDVFIGYYTITK